MYIDSSLVPCDHDGNPIPKGKPCTVCSQTVAFDVLYDRTKAKEELQLLIKIIDKFQMTEKQKKAMEEAEVEYKYQTIYEITYNCLSRLLNK